MSNRKKAVQLMLQKVRFARAVEDAARAQIEFATSNEDWDRDPWLLGTPGGVVELKTGKLRPGLPTDMISKVTAVAPADDEICPQWVEFINFALNADTDNIDFLKRNSGYALTGLTAEERLLFIIGHPGAGKGTLTKTFISLLGDYATNMPVTMFTDKATKQEYYRAGLHGYRLVLASEPEKDSVWSEAFVNEVTGSDRLNGRHPGGRPFTFNPTHKLWINGNTAPDLKGVATGMKRRLDMLPFDQVPDEPDTKLKDKLAKEGSGILRWAINGCLAWQQEGLAPPPDVQAAAAEYFATQDTFRRWVDDCCDPISTARETPQDLRNSYNAWAARNNEKPMTSNAFYAAVKLSPLKLEQTTIHGKQYVRGLALKPTDDDGSPYRRD
jgi:putative DNA primase/helicase